MTTPHITIYHNGECSKCRGALEIMQEQGIPHTIRWFLAAPLDKNELTALLQKLGIPASTLVRKSEPVYKENYEGKTITEDEWLDILVQSPILIERPIVEKGDRAIIARPPEKLFDILGKPL
jgi:arsenate reductase (glutaredoxin)